MRELSLFTGAGGGLLGSVLLGHRIVGAVEIDEYCCKVLEQRQRDGILERFPIFQTDIRDFIRHGYADLYKGQCDLISGGFPCQPFSLAGKRKGADDERNMWPATAECVRIIRPRFCLFENVPSLLTSGYFGTVVADLAACGYGVRWRVLSAAELGAPHKRDRVWIVAHRDNERLQKQARKSRLPKGESVLPASRGRLLDGSERHSWWDTEPQMDRVVHGYANRMAEMRAAGNAQVASVVAAAWRLLTEDWE